MERNILVKSLGFFSLTQMAWGLLILCILDAWLTDLGIRTGLTYEVNPLANYLYELDGKHLWFYLIKTILPLLVLFLSLRVQHQKFVFPFFWIATAAYSIILFFHIVWITVYLRMVF